MPNILDIVKDPLTSLVQAAGGIIDRFVASPEDKLKAQLALTQLSADTTVRLATLDAQSLTNQASVVTAEANGQSSLQRNWRPITMLTFVFIIAFNYIIAPIGQMFGVHIVPLPITTDMWDLLKIGIGGYIALRSGEKMVDSAASAYAAKAAQPKEA